MAVFAGCGPKSDDYYGRGYEDGKKLGKSQRQMSARYLPPDATQWPQPAQDLYEKGYRDGDAARIHAEMTAQGIQPPKPPATPPKPEPASQR